MMGELTLVLGSAFGPVMALLIFGSFYCLFKGGEYWMDWWQSEGDKEGAQPA